MVLTNTGTGPLTVTAVKTTGDFSETTNCSSIAVGAQCSVAVGFTPTQTGVRSGQLSITDNVGSSPQLVALSGTGTDFALQGAAGSQLSATMTSGAAAVYNVAVDSALRVYRNGRTQLHGSACREFVHAPAPPA